VEAVVVLGALGGAVAARGGAAALERLAPTVELAFRAPDLALVPVAFAVASGLAALGPVARLAHVDPVEAFRP
jgi:hypothetical protein